MTNPPKEKDTPKEAANELEEKERLTQDIYKAMQIHWLSERHDAILSLIESEKIKAVEPFRQAMVNKGSHPEYHDQQVEYLKQHWPTLYNLLEELESKEEA